VVLNLLSWWFSISTPSLLCFKFYLSHSVAVVAGSIIKGVLTVFSIIIAFSIDNVSAGNPSFFHVSSYDSVHKNVLKLNSYILVAYNHSLTFFSLTVSFAPPK
jgi:hypothetical protein